MNILPKKSWHVRTKKNIEKVRKDEAQAREEENRKRQRAELAEREARTDYLRKRARSNHSKHHNSHYDDSVDPARTSSSSSSSTAATRSSGHNVEREEEERQNKEKWEKRVGITQYLHEKSDEGDRPWYTRSHGERLDEWSNKAKPVDHLDPLVTMNKYFDRMKKAGMTNPPAKKS